MYICIGICAYIYIYAYDYICVCACKCMYCMNICVRVQIFKHACICRTCRTCIRACNESKKIRDLPDGFGDPTRVGHLGSPCWRLDPRLMSNGKISVSPGLSLKKMRKTHLQRGKRVKLSIFAGQTSDIPFCICAAGQTFMGFAL